MLRFLASCFDLPAILGLVWCARASAAIPLFESQPAAAPAIRLFIMNGVGALPLPSAICAIERPDATDLSSSSAWTCREPGRNGGREYRPGRQLRRSLVEIPGAHGWTGGGGPCKRHRSLRAGGWRSRWVS